MNFLTKEYGINVFNDEVMKNRLSEATYNTLKKTVESSEPLDTSLAEDVAKAMMEWAIEKGATHYTHWFQPMTGTTAEKHDSFLSPVAGGKAITEFSGKELIKGEPDASSFPSGGLRATFEARGYTAWDPTSYAFIKEGVLCIPTAFCSYSGHALDKKTPLLRSMRAINNEAMRVLRLLGNTTSKSIVPTVGAEQEYFLVDKKLYEKREDLMICGRTLFGNPPPKAQQMSDHYFGAIKPRVHEFMSELNHELWKLGIPAKTEHNEAAPAQHELAPVYSTVNVATDENQIVMEMMRKVAERHGLECLLHEKPFEGVCGSGKHNNWALSTDDGINLFKAGKKPAENLQFLLFLSAVIKAVDEYQDLLRVSASGATNDNRLGGYEAPPAIISIFLGDELTDILTSIENGEAYLKKNTVYMQTGSDVLPKFKKDTTDRNRTSPFAFTGNKFEFRMLGSSASIGCTNIILNTIVADALGSFADELEKVDDVTTAVYDLIRRTIKEHKRIIFNGDGYSEEWIEEAKKRGLLNLASTVDALPHYIKEKNIALFEKHGVLCKEEMLSRYEILVESYINVVRIEAATLAEMVSKRLVPNITKFSGGLAKTLCAKNECGLSLGCYTETELLKTTSYHCDSMYKKLSKLKEDIAKERNYPTSIDEAAFCHDVLIKDMVDIRSDINALENIIDSGVWPYPTYTDLMFKI